MKGRAPNKAERDHMARVQDLGCICCRSMGHMDSPAELHHTIGKTKPDAHFKVLPLCSRHHRCACPNGDYATRHAPGRRAGKFEFERAYGTEQQLLELIEELLSE